LDITFRKMIKRLKTDIEKLDLKIIIGTEDASLTAFLVVGISLLLSLVLKKQITDRRKQRFLVMPVYKDTNVLKINITGIFKISLIKYITSKKDMVRSSVI